MRKILIFLKKRYMKLWATSINKLQFTDWIYMNYSFIGKAILYTKVHLFATSFWISI